MTMIRKPAGNRLLPSLLLSAFAIAVFPAGAAAETEELLPGTVVPETPFEEPGADLSRFYFLRQTTTHGPFRVEQWISREQPEVSPAGMGSYVLVIHRGEEEVLRRQADFIALNVVAETGQDLDGDDHPEIVLAGWTGGANCCNWLEIYAIEPVARLLYSGSASSCQGEIEDLDGDGRFEVRSCDPRFAREFCSFAESPFPPVVYALGEDGRYGLATPRYARYLPDSGGRSTASGDPIHEPLDGPTIPRPSAGCCCRCSIWSTRATTEGSRCSGTSPGAGRGGVHRAGRAFSPTRTSWFAEGAGKGNHVPHSAVSNSRICPDGSRK